MDTAVLVPDIFIDAADTLQLGVNGQSKRAYASDVRIFVRWLEENFIATDSINYSVMMRYHSYLLETYSSATAARRWVVVRRLLHEAVKLGFLRENPAEKVEQKIKVEDSEPHIALSKHEVKRLLAAIDTSTALGKRDYALLLLLIFTGLRRNEATALVIGDISSKQEHMVLTVQHGKGKKRRDIPLRPEVFRAIHAYLEATNRLNDSPDSLLFMGFYKGDTPRPSGITDHAVENIVKAYASKAGLTCTPHDLRATFITLAIDTGSPVIKVQRLAGHSSPTTTERYYARKTDLDDSPVYKISLDM